ncbi:MAG: TetR/AcrR family transcriptional regulator [Deltaproteobacteria bacterium]|nr:TetR/AcrR family transcriptional regulator [Deltaproteobacteria bacterium]
MTIIALPTSRPQRAASRRRTPQIIDAAARVFAERGFHDTTTQDIADALGIRQASLYYYFASKEAALELVCLKGGEGFFEAAKAIARAPGSARAKLVRLIQSHLSPLRNRADYVHVFLNDRQHLPTESRHRVGRLSRGLERLLEDVIKEGIRSGEFRRDLDSRLITLAVLGMCNAVSGWHRKEEIAIERIAEEFARLVEIGVRKKPLRRRARPGGAER